MVLMNSIVHYNIFFGFIIADLISQEEGCIIFINYKKKLMLLVEPVNFYEYQQTNGRRSI